MKEYQQLINNISQIILKYDEMDRINGSKFNIFQILNVAEDELKHSLFIAELLNPKGRHGLGALFLKFFLEKVEILDFNAERSNIETEFSLSKSIMVFSLIASSHEFNKSNNVIKYIFLIKTGFFIK